MSHFPAPHRLEHQPEPQQLVKVTNQDLADILSRQDTALAVLVDKIDKLNTRLVAIESEAKVAKWVLRLIGGLVASVVATVTGYFLTHHK